MSKPKSTPRRLIICGLTDVVRVAQRNDARHCHGHSHVLISSSLSQVIGKLYQGLKTRTSLNLPNPVQLYPHSHKSCLALHLIFLFHPLLSRMHPASIIYMLHFICVACAVPLGQSMARRSSIVPHSLTNFITENLPQARHDDRLTLYATHSDSPQSTGNPVVSRQNSDISDADRSRISKHDPNDLDNPRLSDDTFFGFSSLDERRISKRGPHDADDRAHAAGPPTHLLSFLDEPHVVKLSPGEEDIDQENELDDLYDTPPKRDINNLLKGTLLIFKNAPGHNRRGL